MDPVLKNISTYTLGRPITIMTPHRLFYFMAE